MRQEEMDALGINEEGLSLEAEVQGAESADEEQFQAIAPQGNFTTKALNNLVAAANRLLPAFEQTPDYPKFEENVQVFPTDFVRVLAMFQGAANSAAENGAIDAEADFQLEDITDDSAINLIAGKLNSLAKSREFKNFLKNPPPEVEEEVEELPEEEVLPNADEMDSFFAGRM